MRNIRLSGLIGLGGLCLLLADSGSYGQRVGGRAGGAVGGSVRAGAAVGPFGGAGAGARSTASVVGPLGSASSGAARGSVTTGRGTTIDYGGVGQKATGPGGATAGRGVGAIQITGANGQQYTKVGAARGAAGPNGAVGQKGSIGVGTGPNGAAASINRGGVAVGPNGAVVGKSHIGAATGPGGAVVGGARTGVAVGPNGLAGYTTRGVAVGHRTNYVAAGALRTQGVYVRRSFVHYDVFRPNWYAVHPRAWRPAAWTATAFWVGATWGRLSAYCGYPPAPVVYDYGSTIVYQDNSVYYNGEPVATADQYAQQAAAIADQGQQAQPSEKDDWVALGVFGMVRGDDTEANQIFQLAINKDGVLRGNYYDALSDTTLPVYGSVDKKTQRAAWTVGDRKDTVYETGVGNLTEDETTMLVHFGKDRTQQWTLIRLEQPDEGK
jgi:hypothetical protein